MSDLKELHDRLDECNTKEGDSLKCEDNLSDSEQISDLPSTGQPLIQEIEEILRIKNESIEDATTDQSTRDSSERDLNIETGSENLNLERSINLDDKTEKTGELAHLSDASFAQATTEQKPFTNPHIEESHDESGDNEKRASLPNPNEIHLVDNKSSISDRLNIELTDIDSSSGVSSKIETVSSAVKEETVSDIDSQQKDLLMDNQADVLKDEKNDEANSSEGEKIAVKPVEEPLVSQEKDFEEIHETVVLNSPSKESCFHDVRANNKIQNEKSMLSAKEAYNFERSGLPAMITPLKHCESFPNLYEKGDLDNEIRLFGHNKLNPIFRLSLKLSPYLPICCEIPNAESHRQYEKAGHLQKLSGRGFPYLHQWKRRYCVLTKGRLFLYEKDSSKGTDKSTSVVDLKYFDHVAEALQKETKKASNVFVVTSQDRSFFDPGRHLFAADTLTEMHEWIHKLRESIELIRNNNRPSSNKQGKAKERELRALLKENIQEQKLHNDAHKQEQDVQKEQPVEPMSEDDVDGSAHKGGILKADFASRLEKKLKVETDGGGKLLAKGGDLDELGENAVDSSTVAASVPDEARKSVSTKIVLQLPSLESKPQLESITKYRTKGPMGRRAPQTRRATQMKHRASSMSALQAEGNPDGEARDNNVDERNCQDDYDLSSQKESSTSLNSSQPILAYHYSSDEDSPEEESRMGSDRSLGMSASGGHPPSGSHTKATSFNIHEVPPHPVKGLRVYLQQKEEHYPSECQSQRCTENTELEDVLEFRSLPRSLARGSSARPLGTRNLPMGLVKRSEPSAKKGSSDRLSSGRASPEMDALDNLLMKRSIQPTTTQDICTSDQEGSDGSTYKATHLEEGSPKKENSRDVELTKALERFSSTLNHLQTHTAELECRTKQIETEFTASRNDVIHLQEATEGIRRDVKRLTENATLVTLEASKAKREYVLQRQETEKLQKETSEALSEAQKSQREFEAVKSNYESTITDLHSLIASIRASFVITEDQNGSEKQSSRITLVDTGKSLSEGDQTKIELTPVSTEQETSKLNRKKTSSKEIGSQKGGYQSFFQRPSSLIYGLTSRSHNKSSNKKGKEDAEGNENKNEEKKKSKSLGNGDKKQTKDKHVIEKMGKIKERTSATKEGKSNSEGLKSHKLENLPELNDGMTGCLTESAPNSENKSNNGDRRPNTTMGISHISLNVNQPKMSYHLEKSLSSPTVTTKFNNSKPVRPNVLNLSPISTTDGSKSRSNTSSPESPVAPGNIFQSPLPFPLPGSTSNGKVLDTSLSRQESNSARQHSSSSIKREGSTSTAAKSRPGVFAIVRQKSSPNIPVQRQSSAPMFPLQRQHSLGTVPEEGQLPRQESLMSVPENRPIVDQTLPLSPSTSMVSFALSPSPSGERLDNLRERLSIRNSMELLTGPVMSGSAFQESHARQLPPASEFETTDHPIATSSIKRQKRTSKGIIV